MGGIPCVPYADLCAATRHWSADMELGSGGFGTVFRGVWKNTAVAIKRVKSKPSTDAIADEKLRYLEEKMVLNELQHLNSWRHNNILPLFAYCAEPTCLVYMLMEGGSLEKRLHGAKRMTEPLYWPDRMRIAIGTATYVC